MSDAVTPGAWDVSPGPNGTMELAIRGAAKGAADAREAADRLISAGSLFASRFVYTTCYTVAYGLVFPTLLVARSVPRDNPAVRGLVDGSGAATRRASALVEGRRTAEGPPLPSE